MDIKRLEEADLSGKTALVRVDFNLPRSEDGSISDDTRLQAALPTIRYLREQGAAVVLLSHFGRPKGKVDPALSLGFVAAPLAEALETPVRFLSAPNINALDDLGSGDVLLMENTRFQPGETTNDPALAKELAEFGDLFVMDAFSAAHRAHASSAGIADYLPTYAGLAMARELDHLAAALDHPETPVMAIVGGAKVSTKIDLLENLVTKLDRLAIGGGMANTFLLAKGHDVGKSLAEPDLIGKATDILKAAQKANCEIILPVDVVTATEFKAGAETQVRAIPDPGSDGVKSDEMILDVGPETVTELMDAMDKSKTLIWNGPLGAFETPPFDTSTIEAAKYAARRVRADALIAVAGGGDTVAALNAADVVDAFTFVSTAGGAFLEWMEGKTLPGIKIVTRGSA
ncbi:phosphoglycerate kinase [Algimonas porphyrae]|uniref:Phosphoglycerate kinase n=1 Tax=Algimonas porphyrae TaxID=1128113 RepID=A0ABQ5V1S6_9PROT|nr:phosphoglycerate kinase [Algimonas porphyrae]GLQ20768.1 phosphoglycerate kinase [Algimonas porphyrae]